LIEYNVEMSATELLPADTPLAARRAHAEILRRMTGDQRLAAAFELTDQLRMTVTAGVRARHPDYDDERVRLAVLKLAIGDELFRHVLPGVDVAP
jgi:hypothetical protein